MNVKGILIEGRDGQEYLLGFHPQPTGRLSGPPTLSRPEVDGAFRLYEDVQEASRVAMAQLGPRGAHVLGPGWGEELFPLERLRRRNAVAADPADVADMVG